MSTQLIPNTTGAFEAGPTVGVPFAANFSFEYFDAMNQSSTALSLPTVTAGTQVVNPSLAAILVQFSLGSKTPPSPSVVIQNHTTPGVVAGFLIDNIVGTPATLAAPGYGGAGTGQVNIFPTGRVVRNGLILAIADNTITAGHLVTISGT